MSVPVLLDENGAVAWVQDETGLSIATPYRWDLLDPWRLLEASQEEQDEYRRKLERILAQSDNLDDQAVANAIEVIRRLQAAIVLEIQQADNENRYNVFYLRHLQAEVQRLSREMARQYSREVGEFLEPAWEAGEKAAAVGETEAAAQAEAASAEISGTLSVAPLPHITPADLGIQTEFSADLITGLEETARETISQEIVVAVQTGRSPAELIRKLSQKIEEGPFRTVEQRAEVIARTEMSRLHSLGFEKRTMQIEAAYPDSGMLVHLLVAEVNGWPCRRCRGVFAQGPWKVSDPSKPSIPIHPNCRCRLIGYFPGITNIPHPGPIPGPHATARRKKA